MARLEAPREVDDGVRPGEDVLQPGGGARLGDVECHPGRMPVRLVVARRAPDHADDLVPAVGEKPPQQ